MLAQSIWRNYSAFRLLFGGACMIPYCLSSSISKSSHLSCNSSVRSISLSGMAAAPPPVIIPAKKEHKSTVIFLHGLGDQGDGWASVFQHEIRADNTKYICPSSASRPVTLNMGMRMPAWFDLFGLSADSREDAEGIQAAANLVHKMLDDEISCGIPANKIILGGFSMGGALALYAGLTYPHKLAGIVGLSSFLVQRTKLPGSHSANLDTPIFLGHGSDDFLVPLPFGQLTEQLIKNFNKNVQLRVYPGMGHSSSPASTQIAACLRDRAHFWYNEVELAEVKKFVNSHVN